MIEDTHEPVPVWQKTCLGWGCGWRYKCAMHRPVEGPLMHWFQPDHTAEHCAHFKVKTS